MENHAYLLFVSVIVFMFHVLEEYSSCWRAWALEALDLAVTEPMFFLTNMVAMIIGLCCAFIGWNCPIIALMFTATISINAVFFHIIPTIKLGKISPGVFSATFLVLPTTLWVLYGAYVDGAMGFFTLICSYGLGILLMFYPILLVKIRDKYCVFEK